MKLTLLSSTQCLISCTFCILSWIICWTSSWILFIWAWASKQMTWKPVDLFNRTALWTQFPFSPFSLDSLAPLGQYGDHGARSPCTARTRTSGRSCRTAPGAFGAVYTFASPALPRVRSACGFSKLQLAGVAPGDFRNMRPGTRGRISQPLIASLCTRHKIWTLSPGTKSRSAFSGGSSRTFLLQRSSRKAPGDCQTQSDTWGSWRRRYPSVMWCRWSRSCDRRVWRRAHRTHCDRWNTETAPLTAIQWRTWPKKYTQVIINLLCTKNIGHKHWTKSDQRLRQIE